MASADRRWAHHTPSLNGLSYRFAVRSDDARLGRYAERVLAGLRVDGPIDHWYSLTASAQAESMVDVCIDGEPGVRASRPADALGWLMWHVNQAAADAGREHLLFHAGGVSAATVGVLMPGASGSGKSTLAAALVRAGLSYLSDELVALDLTDGRLLPYAKPITVKPGSFGVLRGMRPGEGDGDAGRCDGDGSLWDGEEWLLPVGEAAGRPVAGRCTPGVLVVPRYDPGAAPRLTPLSETEAFVALAVNAVNFKQHGADGARALGALVARCTCVALTMSDLDEACRLVLDVVGSVRAG